MSSHSRSSSIVEPLQIREIVPIFYKLLRDNLDFIDIKDRVAGLFENYEINEILNECNESGAALRLIWTLVEKDETICDRFVAALQCDYKFIKDNIMKELNQPNELTHTYLEEVKKLRSSDQKFTEYNVHRMKPFLELHKALKQLKRFHNVVLHGDLGAGKKWLALDVLSEYSVQKAMDFKIYWLNVKNCTSPETDLGVLQQLRLMVDTTYRYGETDNWTTGGGRIEDRIFHQQTELKRLFDQKKFSGLVVLADVQNVKTLRAFNLGCKLLVLTRNKSVSDYLSISFTTHLRLDDELTEHEIECLFANYMRCKRDKLPKEMVHRIAKKTMNPLKLSFIAANLRENKNEWRKWIDINFKKLTSIVACSLKVLDVKHLRYFAMLSIFPEGADIPVYLLAALWDNPSDIEEIIYKLDKYSFVKRNAEEGTITLPNIYSTELRLTELVQSQIDSYSLHKKVVDSFNIDDAFDKRTDTELPNMPSYFYSYIIYHLQHLTPAECRVLFPKIFLDFGFLEQKIRLESCSILNSLIQLNYYRKSDYCDERQRRLISAICQFLPKVEEKIIHSKDTCLLQYALMENGLVYEEARRQQKWYPQQVWFSEKGSFHQRRHVLKLNRAARFASYLDHEICLLVLESNEILRADFSLECNTGITELNNHGNPAIRQLQVFNKQQHLLTLDDFGCIKLWSFVDERATSGSTKLVHRRSSKQKVHCLDLKQIPKSSSSSSSLSSSCSSSGDRPSTSKQHMLQAKWIYSEPKTQRGRIVAFHAVEAQPPYPNIELLIVYENGDLRLYEWFKEPLTGEQSFRHVKTPAIETKLRDICALTKVLNKYNVLLTASGVVSIWDTRNTARVFERSFLNPIKDPRNAKVIGMLTFVEETNQNEIYTVALFIFSHKVLELRFLHADYCRLENNDLEPTVIYEQDATESVGSITCAKLSPDNLCLLLGTEQGLIVFDMKTKSPALRSNVSESIACVDIACMDEVNDGDPKYIVLCGAVGNTWLHIHALRPTGEQLTWMHNVESMGNELSMSNNARLEPDVRLRGKKLFEVSYDDADGGTGCTQLLAVDSKNRIHTFNTNNWTVMPKESDHPITGLTSFGQQQTFVGYKNGEIFNFNKEEYLVQSHMDVSIDYLQLMDEQILIASSNAAAKTLVYDLSAPAEYNHLRLATSIMQAYRLFKRYILLISRDNVLCLDLEARKLCKKCDHNVVAWDYQNSTLLLASKENTLFIYNCAYYNNDLKMTLMVQRELIKQLSGQHLDEHLTPSTSISCLAASNDGSLIAMGYSNGSIEVYKCHDMNKITYIYCLESHTREICQLRFSPNMDVLVSCAEQMCFWNISHIINNQHENIMHTTKRRSSRFSSQSSYDEGGACASAISVEEVDAKPMSPYGRQLRVHNGVSDSLRIAALHARNSMENSTSETQSVAVADARPWLQRSGLATKPELFACIKFDGNRAEKFFANSNFTQFNTIDDEGVYYQLELLPVHADQLTHNDDDAICEDEDVDVNFSRQYSIGDICMARLRTDISMDAVGDDIVGANETVTTAAAKQDNSNDDDDDDGGAVIESDGLDIAGNSMESYVTAIDCANVAQVPATATPPTLSI